MESKAVSLYELCFGQYLAKNPPKTRQDRDNTKTAFMLLLEQFPNADTANFTADHLIIFRNTLAQKVSEKTGKTLSIDYVNKLVGFVRAVFNWGMSPNLNALSEADIIPPLVTPTLCFALSKVPNLQPGEGRQNAERSAVPEASIEAVLPHLPPVIADILRVQLLTGMRPGEVCKMRAGDLRTTREEFGKVSHLHDGEMWLYVMTEHKTARKVGTRAIPLGAEEQEILGKYLSDDPAAPIWRNQKGRMMTGAVYSNTLAEVIKEHGLPKFVPYQLRHTRVTLTSKIFGQDAARVVAGHTTAAMTARYDHSDLEKAFEVVKERNRQYLARRSVSDFGDDVPPKVPGDFMLRVFSGE